MILTNKQEEGLKIAVQRYRENESWTCIAGFAGTGKSTLVKFIISSLNIDPADVAYIAYTGKAALVLRDKGCPNAQTAHRLLYQSFPRTDGTFFHKPRRPLDRDYKLIVVDEVSMLPKDIWELLLSHKVHVIALGDPFQLPPIGEDNGILSHPHVFLDEVMRQAQESEILRLSMDIRDGKGVQLFKGNELQILQKSDIVEGMFTWADQIIVGKNETRRNINRFMRNYLYGVTDQTPIEGDKLICLRNDWEHASANGDVCINGTIGTIHNIKVNNNHPWLHPEIIGDFISDEYTQEDIEQSKTDLYFRNVNFDAKLLMQGEPTVTQYNFKRFPKVFKPNEFDYGYAITCHKSQGSEYGKVLVLEEFLGGGDHARWLYTAVTRAKDKLVLVKDYR